MRNVSLTNDLLNSQKILFHFGRVLKDYYAGRRDFNPVAVEIHPTAMCNHKCTHCSYSERNEKRTSLKKPVMDALVDSVIDMGVSAVYFSGGGEPGLYPGIKAYVEKLHGHGIDISLITNGTYLEESGILDIAHMFAYIAVSIPSTNENKFEEITGRPNLPKILALPAKIKRTHRDKAPILGSRVVVTNRIYGDVIRILNDIKDSLYDYALFKIVRDYEDKGYGLSESETKAVKLLIEQNRCQLDDDFTNLSTIFDYRTAPASSRCLVNDIGFLASIDSDGKVYPNITEIGQSAFCIGDLNETPLHDMWNSQRHAEVKRVSNEKCARKQCKNCRAIAYNHIMEHFMGGLPKVWDNFI